MEALWRAGGFEERLLATKVLGGACKKDPDRALGLAKKVSAQISDWAVCDTLATQGLRGIAVKKQVDLLAWSRQLVKSTNPWERRLALVLLMHFIKDKDSRVQIEETLTRLSDNKEY